MRTTFATVVAFLPTVERAEPPFGVAEGQPRWEAFDRIDVGAPNLVDEALRVGERRIRRIGVVSPGTDGAEGERELFLILRRR
jgi:hypothetical protein